MLRYIAILLISVQAVQIQSLDNTTNSLVQQLSLTVPKEPKGKMSEKDVQAMVDDANTLSTNLHKEYEAFKKEADVKKLDAFYTKITKLVDYVPFVR